MTFETVKFNKNTIIYPISGYGINNQASYSKALLEQHLFCSTEDYHVLNFDLATT